VIEYRPDELRFRDGTLVAAGTQELATPTTSARTKGGSWALYALGEEQVLVAHPGGAVAGPAAEVAARLDELASDGPDDDRAVASRLKVMVTGDTADPGGGPAGPETGARGYHLSGPRNLPAGPAGSASGDATQDAPSP
jgi:hypothetical protein